MAHYCTMKDWDDHRFALAVSRTASVKRAADNLGVNRSTVLRRINAFEATLGVRLFDRLPSGYLLTPAGEQVAAVAEEMEKLVDDGERRVAGQDIKLQGRIRVSISATLLSYILVPAINAFIKTYPQIELEIVTTYGLLDLAKREADVAIRISNDPPEDLVGRRVLRVARAVYEAENDALAGVGEGASGQTIHHSDGWIGWFPGANSSPLIEESDFSDYPIITTITDPHSTVKAIAAGVGISILPCYIGDQEPQLRRKAPGKIERATDLWVLTHKDLRQVARIRTFVDFIYEELEKQKMLLEGERPKGE